MRGRDIREDLLRLVFDIRSSKVTESDDQR